MVTTLCYKVIDLSAHDDSWSAHMEDVLNQQAEEGWELVTAFERTHKAQQVGSTTVHVPGLVGTVLVFKKAGERSHAERRREAWQWVAEMIGALAALLVLYARERPTRPFLRDGIARRE
jgi:Domain of unknown function (DUF4177)